MDLSWSAAGDFIISSAALRRFFAAKRSPPLEQPSDHKKEEKWQREAIKRDESYAATTLARASRVASASAAIARCMFWGRTISLISTRSTLTPHGSVAYMKKNNQQVDENRA